MSTIAKNKNFDNLVWQVPAWLIRLLGLCLVVFVVGSVTFAQLSDLAQHKDSWQAGYVKAEDRTKQLACLTKNIYWEAAKEPFEGKVAVAQVTMNRVESGKFASDVCGVVYQKNVIYDKVICQFSWYCEDTHKNKPVYPVLWKESEEVAKKVLLEGFRLPSMTQALYYHADYVSPGWNRFVKIDKIGAHIFYREKS